MFFFFLFFFGKNFARKQKKVAKFPPKNFFSKKKEQIWSCMGKQCKMCFLGYGHFFFSGMDRLSDPESGPGFHFT